MDYFGMIRKGAEDLQREMKRPGGKPNEMDFAVMPQCFMCDKMIMAPKPLRCSACQSTIYCSKACHSANWKRGKIPGAPTHAELCKANKVHMRNVPTVRKNLTQFPWGRVEEDGSFAADLARALLGVLGGIGYGYWSEAGGLAPHLSHANTPPSSSALRGALKTDAKYQHGYVLLKPNHPDDKAGWRLEKRLIPHLAFDGSTMPIIASKADIVDWESWYNWRKLPKESPAALLMHYSLSVYQLLVHVLHVVHPKRGSPDDRQEVAVHYLGAEVELNMIPLFAELALLLPYTDINLKLFGVAVRDIVEVAQKKHPNSLAAKAAASGSPVYQYTAPTSLGAGTLRVYLHGDSENWEPSAQYSGSPADALVAPNAGLLSYQAWQPVIQYCLVQELPFGVTEYAEQSAETQRMAFPKMASVVLQHMSARLSAEEKSNLTKHRQYPIALNPFHRPGQRPLPQSRLPNMENGFTLRVVGTGAELPLRTQEESSTSGAADEVSDITEKMEKHKLEELD